MGLLDSLLNQTYGNGGGLLGYLQSPLYQSPLSSKSETDDFVKALRNDPYGGSMLAPPQTSPFDQPGITYRAAPSAQADPFKTGMAPIAGFPSAPSAPQPMPQAPQTAPMPPQPPQMPSPAPPQAEPLSIGNYQMPRIGAASAYEPQQSSIPPNAQPTQGQMPQQATQQPMEATPPAFLQSSPGGLGGAFRGAMANMSNGPLGLIGGAIAGGLGMGQGNPQDVARQNMKAQFDALRQTLQQSGMSPQEASSKAMLAVINPEAGKTILSEALTNKEKYGVISEDPLEGKRYGFINERDQTVNGKPIAQQGAATPGGGGMAALQAAQNAGVTGEALYDHLPTQMRGVVKAMIEGRQPLPSTTSMRNPATLALIDAAHAIDPTFDATTWKARQSGQVDFTSGKSAEMVRSANQTLHHVGQLLTSMDDLKNQDYPLLNRIGNAYAEAKGSGAQGAFRTNAHAVAEELSKVFKGSNLSDAEIRSWEQNLHENMSPEQQHTQILKLKDLLQGSLHALEEKRVSSIGPMAAEKAGPIIKEEGQKVLERIDDWVKGIKTPEAESAAPKLKTGQSATVNGISIKRVD